jgi:hypothetical protein
MIAYFLVTAMYKYGGFWIPFGVHLGLAMGLVTISIVFVAFVEVRSAVAFCLLAFFFRVLITAVSFRLTQRSISQSPAVPVFPK